MNRYRPGSTMSSCSKSKNNRGPRLHRVLPRCINCRLGQLPLRGVRSGPKERQNRAHHHSRTLPRPRRRSRTEAPMPTVTRVCPLPLPASFVHPASTRCDPCVRGDMAGVGLQHPLLPREAGQHSAGWRCGRRCGNGHRLLWVNDPASICKPSSCRRSPRWCQGHPGFRLRDRIRQSVAPLSG